MSEAKATCWLVRIPPQKSIHTREGLTITNLDQRYSVNISIETQTEEPVSNQKKEESYEEDKSKS